MKIRKLNKKGFEMQKLVGFILILVVGLLLLYFTPNAFGELKKKWDDIFKKSVDDQLLILKEQGLFNTPADVRQDILHRGDAEQLKQFKEETLQKFDDSCNGDENFKNVLDIVDLDSKTEDWATRIKDGYGAAVCEQLSKCIFEKSKNDAKNVGLYLERCGKVYSGVIGEDIYFYYDQIKYDKAIELFEGLTNNLQNFNDFNSFDLSAVGQYYLNKGKLSNAKKIYNSDKKYSLKLRELDLNAPSNNNLFSIYNPRAVGFIHLDEDYGITINKHAVAQATLNIYDKNHNLVFNCIFETESSNADFMTYSAKLIYNHEKKKWYNTRCETLTETKFDNFLVFDIFSSYNGVIDHKRGIISIEERS